MKKNNFILILILIIIIIISLIFIVRFNNKIENMVDITNYVQSGNTNDKMIHSYNNLNKWACFAECTQNTTPTKCNFALTSADMTIPQSSGECKLYENITPTHSENNSLMYNTPSSQLSPSNIVNKPTNVRKNRGYNNNAIPLSTINYVHKLTCDYECGNNNLCTGYTSNLTDDSTNHGTCTFYNEPTRNNIKKMPGTYLYSKPITN
jgi:hypothetical protein